MTTVAAFNRRLRSLRTDTVAKQCIKENTDILRLYNIDQLDHGNRASGGKIGEYKSASYSKFKRQLNPTAGGKVDLILTGESAFSIKAVLKSDTIIWTMRKDKHDLVGGYGSDILGITKTNRNKFRKKLRPIYMDKLKAKLKL